MWLIFINDLGVIGEKIFDSYFFFLFLLAIVDVEEVKTTLKGVRHVCCQLSRKLSKIQFFILCQIDETGVFLTNLTVYTILQKKKPC